MAVTCVPMPPFFLALPLRQMMLPFIGPLPVNSQIRAIGIPFFNQEAMKVTIGAALASMICGPLVFRVKSSRAGQRDGGTQVRPGLGQPRAERRQGFLTHKS